MHQASFKHLLKKTFTNYKNDNITTYAASLSYFTAFSLSPLVILSISLVGYLFGEHKAQQEAVSQVQKVIGPEGAQLVNQLIVNASTPGGGTVATIIGIGILIFGASRVFSSMEISLNNIWQVETAKSSGFATAIKDKLLTFSMVAVIGFLFLVSLLASISLSIATNIVEDFLPYSHFLVSLLNFFIPYILILILFALILRLLPNVKIPWKIILYGAALASLLFSMGKIAITYYITHSSVASTYGAAGSLIVLLLWVFYSAQILYISTEFMKAYTSLHGIPIKPKRGNIRYSITTSTEEDKEKQRSHDFGERILSLVLSGLLLRFLKKLWEKK